MYMTLYLLRHKGQKYVNIIYLAAGEKTRKINQGFIFIWTIILVLCAYNILIEN